MMKILVTGGAGFIGSNLCRALIGNPQISEVRVIDDLSTGSLANLQGLDVRFEEASVLEAHALNLVCRGVDAIVHLAALPSVPRSIKSPVASHEVNATGTLRVLEAARQQEAYVIVASSSSVYGANAALPKSETMAPLPMSPYAASKLAAEAYALAWQRSYGLPTLAFRFFNVFGPRQTPGHAYAAVIPTFLHGCETGTAVALHGDGTQTRDFTFVDTVTEVINSAITRRLTFETPINLALGARCSLNTLIEVIESQCGRRLSLIQQPNRPGDVAHSSADPTLLHSLFPNIEATPLAVGIERTRQWMQSYLQARA